MTAANRLPTIRRLARSEYCTPMGAVFATGLDSHPGLTVTDQEALQAVQEAIGYVFKDQQLLVAALTHASIADTRVQSNERLEFVGDSILGMVVCNELYQRFPEYLEGELTKIKSAVVSRRIYAEISRELGLPRFLFIGKGMNGRA